MIVKAFLAAMGLKAIPAVHNEAVHDALNVRAAIMAGHSRMLRLQRARDRVEAAGDTEAVAAITAKQSDLRAALDDLARRLG